MRSNYIAEGMLSKYLDVHHTLGKLVAYTDSTRASQAILLECETRLQSTLYQSAQYKLNIKFYSVDRGLEEREPGTH